MKSLATILVAFLLLACDARAGPLHRVGTFSQPTYVTGARGFPHLLFVTERDGAVRVMRRGRILQRPFLTVPVSTETERGLLSIAFPPDYRKSGRCYVFYSDPAGDIQVDEYRRLTPTVADPTSRRSVLHIDHPKADIHYGGQMQFHGKDLLISTGDGGGNRVPTGGDPYNNAQDTHSLLGKLLRIVPRRTDSGRPYGVPRSNPFVGKPGRDEVFAYGLRNPWRFSIWHTRKRDLLLIADVGQSRMEEINYLTFRNARGANFGWDAWEGTLPYDCGALCPNSGTPDPGGTTFPIFTYGRENGNCAVVGGYVIRGRYVYADFCGGELRSFEPRLRGAVNDHPFGAAVEMPTSFGQTPDGRSYVTSIAGPVYRITQ